MSAYYCDREGNRVEVGDYVAVYCSVNPCRFRVARVCFAMESEPFPVVLHDLASDERWRPDCYPIRRMSLEEAMSIK